MTERFRFLADRPYEEMPELMNLAGLVVHASEGGGMSRGAIEAMASGKFLITSDIAPSKELIRDGENGLLFPVRNPELLAEKLLLAGGELQLRERLGWAARESVQDRSIEQSVESYERDFLSLSS